MIILLLLDRHKYYNIKNNWFGKYCVVIRQPITIALQPDWSLYISSLVISRLGSSIVSNIHISTYNALFYRSTLLLVLLVVLFLTINRAIMRLLASAAHLQPLVKAATKLTFALQFVQYFFNRRRHCRSIIMTKHIVCH